jgi:D-3-phosphoglycerate dehydrogenase
VKKKVLYYNVLNFQPENIALLKNNFHFVTTRDPDSDTKEILKEIDIVFAPLGYYCGKEKIDAMPKLKIIASNTTGTPHIDTEYAEKKNIKVISLKNQISFLSTITPTAEHTWGLLLSLTRRIPWAFNSVCEGAWNRRLFGGKRMLSNMTLGIVGLGRLGKMVANYGKSFGMEIRYFDPYVTESPITGIAKVESLEELVSTSDVVTIHIPLEKDTKGLFDSKIFSKFKEGAYLINTSRAEIIDSTELLKHLENGKFSGAALDVIDGEFEKALHENVKYHALIKYARHHDNLLITPHIGGSTIDAWRLTEEYTIKLIINAVCDFIK